MTGVSPDGDRATRAAPQAPTGLGHAASVANADIEAIRAEFVQFQFGFHQFSDHYSVVATFVAKKMTEVAQAIEARQGGNGEAGAVHESAVSEGDAP